MVSLLKIFYVTNHIMFSPKSAYNLTCEYDLTHEKSHNKLTHTPIRLYLEVSYLNL